MNTRQNRRPPDAKSAGQGGQQTATKVRRTPRQSATDPATKAATLQLAATIGVPAASAQTGIPSSTIRNWQARDRKRQEIVPAGPTKHGAYSPAQIARRASSLRAELFVIAPDLAEPRFSTAVDEYLRAVARAHLLDDSIKAVCVDEGAAAVPSRTWEQATAAARLVAKLGRDLALDPSSAARLKHTAVDVQTAHQRLEDHMRRVHADA